MKIFGNTPHPLPQTTYTGVRTTVLGNQLFPSFLGKTKREWVLPGHFHGRFWPHSLRFALWFLVPKSPTQAPPHSALGEWTQYKYYNCDNLERISHLRTSNPTWWDKLVDLGHSQNWPLGPKIGQKWPKLLKNGSKISFVGFDGSRWFKLNGKEL